MSDDIKKPLGTNIPMPKELMRKQFYTQEEMVMKSAYSETVAEMVVVVSGRLVPTTPSGAGVVLAASSV